MATIYNPVRGEHVVAHGHSGGGRRTPTYVSWQNMVARCRNVSSPSFPRYGGRGVTVCPRWLDFPNFLADMGERPAGTQLGRIDHDRNYEPGNAAWTERRANVAESNRRRAGKV
jgi:hypothetical protein